ncbi:MAG: hypothetical protein IPK79_03035 [Vampirovibrionales bacterium]|nr:hypothetical protein [Vampirovibrionales bacterium]
MSRTAAPRKSTLLLRPSDLDRFPLAFERRAAEVARLDRLLADTPASPPPDAPPATE